ncbi:MAG: aminotransferase class V-fold PLP-dependent enzyme [Candidatus Thorarchaeota archaeon]
MNNYLTLEDSDQQGQEAINKLEKAIYGALETYSNVHRGTGHNSLITTELYEEARSDILDFLNLNKNKYTVVFCSPRRFEIFKTQLGSSEYHSLSSKEYDLPLGVRAIAVKKKTLRKCSVIYTGGGMIKHVTSNYVIWADIPNRFEAGTPNILNIIGFAAFIQFVKNINDGFKIHLPQLKESIHEILYEDELKKFSGIELLYKLQKLLIGRNFKVPTATGMKNFINLDNAASTPSFFPIWNTISKTLKQPKEIHQDIIIEVKKIISKFINAPLDKYDIIFTLNTTEAINIVAQSLAIYSQTSKKFDIVNTILEHHSNELPFRFLPNANLIRIAVDDEGFIDLKELEAVLCEHNLHKKRFTKPVELVAVSAVSNVLGTRNDLKVISNLVHKYGAKLLVDGAQLVAHHKIDISEINIDFFAFSGHKTYAPFGTGVLVVKNGLLSFSSNDYKSIKLSGEENIVGIAALGKAVLLLERIGIEKIEDYEKKLVKNVIEALNRIQEVKIFGFKSSKSKDISKQSSIISFNLTEVPHNVAAKELAEYGGIGIRNGCFCAHMLIQKILELQLIRILGARMTSLIFPKRTAMCLPGTLRVSFGIENDDSDVHSLIKTIKEMVQKPRSKMDKLFGYTNNGTLFIPKSKTEEVIKFFINTISKRIFPT